LSVEPGGGPEANMTRREFIALLGDAGGFFRRTA